MVSILIGISIGLVFLTEGTNAFKDGGARCIDVDANETIWHQRQGYDIRCPKGGQIVDLSVTSGRGRCSSRSCTGLSAYLIEEKLNCFWQKDCLVRIPKWPAKDIIVQAYTNPAQCYGRVPEFLEISKPSCLKQDYKIVDISQKTEKSGVALNPCQSEVAGNALIRSHSFYPWDYEGVNRVFKAVEYTSYCVSLIFKGSDKIVITVRDYDMWEDDKLWIKTTNSKMKEQITANEINENFVYQNEASVQIVLEVNVGSRGGSGFVLCVAYVDSSRGDVDACSEIVYPADVGLVTPTMVSDPTKRPDLSTTIANPLKLTVDPETCRDCKKRCKKVPKKEKKTCRKSCKPPKCKKAKRSKKPKKGKRKKNKKSKRHLIRN